MSKTKPITALYMRVSTTNQKHDRQRTILSEWAKNQRLRKGEFVWYSDKISGTTDAKSRNGLAKLLRDIDRGKVHTVVIERLDRLSRSTRGGLEILAKLADSGIRVVAVKQDIDFSGMMGTFLSTLFLALGQFEKSLLSERVKEGMRAAREIHGTHIGRPTNPKRYELVAKMKAKNMSVQEIATKLNIRRQSVYYLLSKAEGNLLQKSKEAA